MALGAMDSRLDLKAVPKLIGMDDELKRSFHLLQYSMVGQYFTGYAGTGKTVFMQNLMKMYAKKYNVPAYYVQGTIETTKTSLIAGHRLKDGSMVAAKALVGQAMEEGAIVGMDETGHLMQEVMLMFNSILDRWRVTSIGDIAIVAAPTFRIMFAGNPTVHAGNTPLPQSFASRLYAVRFDYPGFSNEVKIVRSIVDSTYQYEIDVPDLVQRYVIGLFRKFRSPAYPLVARNMASAIIALNADHRFAPDGYEEFVIRDEAVARNLCGMAHVSEAKMPDVIRTFSTFIGKVGVDRFKACLEGAALTHLDVDTGQDVGARGRLAAAILTKERLEHERWSSDDDDLDKIVKIAQQP